MSYSARSPREHFRSANFPQEPYKYPAKIGINMNFFTPFDSTRYSNVIKPRQQKFALTIFGDEEGLKNLRELVHQACYWTNHWSIAQLKKKLIRIIFLLIGRVINRLRVTVLHTWLWFYQKACLLVYFHWVDWS